MKHLKSVSQMSLPELEASYKLAERLFSGNSDLFIQEDMYNHMESIMSEYKKRFYSKKVVRKSPTIQERKEAFVILVREYEQIYTDNLLKEFCGYWTEHGHNDKQMRFEKQESFDISRRLSTWKRKQTPKSTSVDLSELRT